MGWPKMDGLWKIPYFNGGWLGPEVQIHHPTEVWDPNGGVVEVEEGDLGSSELSEMSGFFLQICCNCSSVLCCCRLCFLSFGYGAVVQLFFWFFCALKSKLRWGHVWSWQGGKAWELLNNKTGEILKHKSDRESENKQIPKDDARGNMWVLAVSRTI